MGRRARITHRRGGQRGPLRESDPDPGLHPAQWEGGTFKMEIKFFCGKKYICSWAAESPGKGRLCSGLWQWPLTLARGTGCRNETFVISILLDHQMQLSASFSQTKPKQKPSGVSRNDLHKDILKSLGSSASRQEPTLQRCVCAQQRLTRCNPIVSEVQCSAPTRSSISFYPPGSPMRERYHSHFVDEETEVRHLLSVGITEKGQARGLNPGQPGCVPRALSVRSQPLPWTESCSGSESNF